MASAQSEGMYKFCRRFYSTLMFPLLVATWQHCYLWVGFALKNVLVTEVEACGCINTKRFLLSVHYTLQFSPSFPSGVGPDLNHQYLCCDSVPLRQWPSSHAFSKYWTSYCPHQRLGKSDQSSDLILPSLYSVVAAGKGRISFVLVVFNLWRFL